MHQLWFADGEYVHMASGAADFEPTHPLDDQFYRCFDVRNPSKPTEVGRWWLPGTRKGDNEPPPARHQKPALDKGNRAHNTNVYPQRPDRMYLAYLDAGMFIMDISDKSKPKPISRFDNSPPYTGFTHTILPLFDRGLVVMTDESTSDNAADWPKLIWILDARDENNLVPISTCPMPNPDDYKTRGGRFGAHNIHENTPRPELVAVGPDHPRHVLQRRACAPTTSPTPISRRKSRPSCRRHRRCRSTHSIQLNDVFVDEREIVYTVDRFSGGLYILEMDF